MSSYSLKKDWETLLDSNASNVTSNAALTRVVTNLFFPELTERRLDQTKQSEGLKQEGLKRE